jgi:hypothetical protein
VLTASDVAARVHAIDAPDRATDTAPAAWAKAPVETIRQVNARASARRLVRALACRPTADSRLQRREPLELMNSIRVPGGLDTSSVNAL